MKTIQVGDQVTFDTSADDMHERVEFHKSDDVIIAMALGSARSSKEGMMTEVTKGNQIHFNIGDFIKFGESQIPDQYLPSRFWPRFQMEELNGYGPPGKHFVIGYVSEYMACEDTVYAYIVLNAEGKIVVYEAT